MVLRSSIFRMILGFIVFGGSVFANSNIVFIHGLGSDSNTFLIVIPGHWPTGRCLSASCGSKYLWAIPGILQ